MGRFGAASSALSGVEADLAKTGTDKTQAAADAIRLEHGGKVGVLVLSQYVETEFALRLVTEGAGGVGYLLKDRVGEVADFADAVRRVARGGSVIDPEVVAVLVNRRRARGPLDELTERIREAIELCLEVEGAPEHDLEFVGIQRVTIAA